MMHQPNPDANVSLGEQYWNPAIDERFTIVGFDPFNNALVQYEDGVPYDISLDHEGNLDGDIDGEFKSITSAASSGPTLAGACSSEEHDFGLNPENVDVKVTPGKCAKCGLSHDVIVEFDTAHDVPSLPFRCAVCEQGYPKSASRESSRVGTVCIDCWESEIDEASGEPLSNLDQYVIHCLKTESFRNDHDVDNDCRWTVRATPETTARFLAKSEDLNGGDPCPECGNSDVRLVPIKSLWTEERAVATGIDDSDEATADDLLGADVDQRRLSVAEKRQLKDQWDTRERKKRQKRYEQPIREREPFDQLHTVDVPEVNLVRESDPGALVRIWPHPERLQGYAEARYPTGWDPDDDQEMRWPSTLTVETSDGDPPSETIVESLQDRGFIPVDGEEPYKGGGGWPVDPGAGTGNDVAGGKYVFNRMSVFGDPPSSEELDEANS